jgi:hypothetical protein
VHLFTRRGLKANDRLCDDLLQRVDEHLQLSQSTVVSQRLDLGQQHHRRDPMRLARLDRLAHIRLERIELGGPRFPRTVHCRGEQSLRTRERIDQEAQLAVASLQRQRALHFGRRDGHRVEDVVEAAVKEFFRFLQRRHGDAACAGIALPARDVEALGTS